MRPRPIMPPPALTAEQQQIKDAFLRVHGDWNDGLDSLLRLNSEFFRAYVDFSAVPWKKNHLDDKVKAFVAITACTAYSRTERANARRASRTAGIRARCPSSASSAHCFCFGSSPPVDTSI